LLTGTRQQTSPFEQSESPSHAATIPCASQPVLSALDAHNGWMSVPTVWPQQSGVAPVQSVVSHVTDAVGAAALNEGASVLVSDPPSIGVAVEEHAASIASAAAERSIG
jgi:hypothetical protein